MWLQSWQVHRGHDLLPPSAAGEVPRAAAASVHHICGPDQGLRLGQQERALPDPPENRLSTQATRNHLLLPPGHAKHGPLQRGYLRIFSSQQWSETGMCPGTNLVRDLLLNASPVRLRRL